MQSGTIQSRACLLATEATYLEQLGRTINFYGNENVLKSTYHIHENFSKLYY